MTGVVAALIIGVTATAMPAGMDSTAYFRYLQGQFIAPCCWAKTVDQERSGPANEVREVILTRLAAGATEQDIRDALVARYGLRILAAPPAEGFQLTAWIMPFVAVLTGGVAAGLAVRGMLRRRAAAPAREGRTATASPPSNYSARLDQELRDYEDT